MHIHFFVTLIWSLLGSPLLEDSKKQLPREWFRGWPPFPRIPRWRCDWVFPLYSQNKAQVHWLWKEMNSLSSSLSTHTHFLWLMVVKFEDELLPFLGVLWLCYYTIWSEFDRHLWVMWVYFLSGNPQWFFMALAGINKVTRQTQLPAWCAFNCLVSTITSKNHCFFIGFLCPGWFLEVCGGVSPLYR